MAHQRSNPSVKKYISETCCLFYTDPLVNTQRMVGFIKRSFAQGHRAYASLL